MRSENGMRTSRATAAYQLPKGKDRRGGGCAFSFQTVRGFPVLVNLGFESVNVHRVHTEVRRYVYNRCMLRKTELDFRA